MRRKKGGEAKPGHEKARQNRTKKKKQRKKGQNRGANGEHERKQRGDLKTEK